MFVHSLFIVCGALQSSSGRSKPRDYRQYARIFSDFKDKNFNQGAYYGKNFNDFVKSYCSRQFSLQKLFLNSETITPKIVLPPSITTKHIFPSYLLIIFVPTPLTISKIYDTIKIAKGKELSQCQT